MSLSLFWDVFWRITSGGVVWIPDKIFKGDINKFLLKPVNPLFNLAVSEIGLFDSSINTPVLLVYFVINNGFYFSFWQIVIYIVMIFVGVGIFTWIMLLIVSLTFWVTHVEYLSQVYWELQNISRYPKDIFGGFLGNLFMYILPIFFIANIPTEVLIKGINFFNLGIGLVLNVVLFFLSTTVWKEGLKKYNGSGI